MDAKTFASDLREMMHVWNHIEAKAREWFPDATEEEIYQITKRAFDHSLGLDRRGDGKHSPNRPPSDDGPVQQGHDDVVDMQP
jgi:hypothetical protein